MTKYSEMKKCTKCGGRKDKEAFHKNWRYPDGYSYHCKDCLNKANNRRRRKKKEREKTEKKERTIESKRLVLKKYTKDEEEISWWLDRYLLGCQICGEDEETLSLDHDHETMEIRGWLCFRCNTGLGFFRDDVDLLQNAIEYLE